MMMRQQMRFAIRFALPAILLVATTAVADDKPDRPRILQTPDGVRFGLLGEKAAEPAATLFVFANDIQGTLGNDSYNKVGRLLAEHGFLSVALDLPCHGADAKPGEPSGLDGWRARLDHGDKLVQEFVAHAARVLDFLVHEGYTDPHRVAACGTSRGGFIALHFAAAEPRVKCVAAFAPVTDLLLLREFAGLPDNRQATEALSLVNHAGQLAGRPVWICIGNHDQRVGTDSCIALTRKLVSASVAQKRPPAVELHVTTSAGHTIHSTAHDEAAAWTLARMIPQN